MHTISIIFKANKFDISSEYKFSREMVFRKNSYPGSFSENMSTYRLDLDTSSPGIIRTIVIDSIKFKETYLIEVNF